MAGKQKKFNVRTFRSLKTEEDMVSYAKQHLKCLGQGSSRIVFAYSPSKALKIALNEKGYAQNLAELQISKNSETQKAIANIFDYKLDSDNNVVWLISEVVRTISDPQEFKELSGFSWDVYMETIRAYAKANAHEELDKITSGISESYTKRVARLKNEGDERNAKYYEQLLKDIETMKSSNLFSGITFAMKTNRLMSGDILELDHYGKTANGNIVLYDYGFTEEIAKKYYPKPAKKSFTNAELSKTSKKVINLFAAERKSEPATRVTNYVLRKRAV